MSMKLSLRKPKLLPLIITIFAVLLCTGLGFWQLHRMDWKQDLKDRITARTMAEAVNLPSAVEVPDDWDYRVVSVTGIFDHGMETYLTAQSTNGNGGYQIITPLNRLDGSVIMVNRGWVPYVLREPETRLEGQIAGEVTITGLARLPWLKTGVAGMLVFDADLTEKIFFEGDLDAMASLHGLQPIPLFVDAAPDQTRGDWPKGGQTVIQMVDNHQTYAFTWFIFATIALVIFLLSHRITPMKYISTRGRAETLDFEEVVLAGLARDGGLYIPEAWPQIAAADLPRLAKMSYSDLAVEIMYPYVEGSFAREEFAELVHQSYATFDSDEVTPLHKLGDDEYLLELYHGPTFAFKDVALQLLGRLFEAILAKREDEITIIGATSGDTGSAAIAACQGRDGIQIYMLHPEGRVSDVQRRQMTTVASNNVFNIAVDGTFDDCQALVKALFNDHEFRDRHNLGAVNSINWARVMAQIVYYFYAALKLGVADGVRPVFAVPTGNFGNIYAGYVAMQMGLPIESLVVATNENDILYRALNDGDYSRREVQATISPAMDIQVSSNFERLLFDLFDRNGPALAQAMNAFSETGDLQISEGQLAKIREKLLPHKVGEADVLATIRSVYERTGIEIDPHTAVGLTAGHRVDRAEGVPLVVLSTAHPAKFPDAMEQALGHEPQTPERLRAVMDGDERFATLPDDVDVLKTYVQGEG
jgi:threonine synthase